MVKAYAVNWSEAWPIPDDEPKEGHYVKYEDYARLKEQFMDYMVVKEKQITNLERALGAGEVRYD